LPACDVQYTSVSSTAMLEFASKAVPLPAKTVICVPPRFGMRERSPSSSFTQ